MNQDLFTGLPYLLAFAISVSLIWVLRPVAYPLGLVDNPGGRKTHQGAVPLVGGVAMFLGVAATMLVFDLPSTQITSFLSGAALLVLIGVLDDLHELSSSARFAAQITAGLMMALWGGVVLEDLGAIGFADEIATLGMFSIPLTVFAAVGVINAVNMSDGIDGLAGALSLIALICLALVAYWEGAFERLPLLGLLITVIGAFLCFNLRLGRASVFMGDAGSMFLGFALAWFLIDFSQGEDRLLPPVVALWIFSVPLIDTVAMMLRRTLKGRSPFAADREHFHHVLLLAGFSPKETLAIIVSVALVCSVGGISAWYLGVPEDMLFFGFLGFFALYFWSIMRAWKVKRFLTRSLHLHGPHHPPRTDNS